MNINIRPDGAINRVHVSQNDVGRTLTFNLFNDSLAYTIPVGATVKIQGTKPSGFGFSETCTVSGNTVTVDTTEAMTDEFGYIDAELQITNSGDVLGTSNFVLVVEKNPHPSNTTDGTQITAQSLQVQIDELAEAIESGGITDDIKQALLDCFAHVAWIDDDGQDYYDALEDALYPPATLVSISCVYTQSGTVYDTDTLDSLKSDLVVTAHYDNSTTQTVTSYTLSGTLTTGTSTITVAYGGKTTTFDVTVTHQEHAWLYNWDFTQSLTDSVEGNTATTTATFTSGTGITYDATLQVTSFALTEMATNSDSLLGKSIEIDIELSSQKGGNNRRILSLYGNNVNQQAVFTYRGGTWQFYTGSAWDSNPTYSNSFGSASYDFFNGKTVKLHLSSTGYLTAYSKTKGADDSTYIKLFESSVPVVTSVLTNPRNCSVGQGGGNDSIANGTLLAFRIFEETI